MKTLLIATLLSAAAAAQAHITLEQSEAEAGKPYKAVLRVGHGCEGGAATKEIVVTLPEGLRGAKPMPKAGWTLSQPAPGQIRWAANTEADYLQDAWYDEFVLRATPAAAGTLWLQVRQVCTTGESNWAEIPASPTDKPHAPALRLVVKPAGGEAAPHAH
ncbi:MAG: YcnI family protein [Burkholderiales bacterium]|nr:YcnI family protein [Burkholderiales bacterium]